jgi:hypothetical protein
VYSFLGRKPINSYLFNLITINIIEFQNFDEPGVDQYDLRKVCGWVWDQSGTDVGSLSRPRLLFAGFSVMRILSNVTETIPKNKDVVQGQEALLDIDHQTFYPASAEAGPILRLLMSGIGTGDKSESAKKGWRMSRTY